jgi:WD40 repeat protein
MNTYECIRSVSREGIRQLLSLPGGYFALGVLNNVEIWDLKNLERVVTLEGHKSKKVTALVLLKDNQIASGSNDGLIKIWSI